MKDVIEDVEKQKVKLISKEEKLLFIRIEEIENRKIYHTKIMKDLYTFGIDKNQKDKFFISLRGLFNEEKAEWFRLFSLKEDNKFLGIYYGYRKPIKNAIRKYEENGIIKSIAFSKVYYIEFRFKKGSVFCYLRSFIYLLRKDKVHKKYYKTLLNMLSGLEKEVYKFYEKKLPEGGLINKWILKNQK
ncbi:DUF226 domain-containing protein (plasmid) [Borrelia miyamotoi]|uniref:DUF226 domain-containing protein n=1 Tax=Borrelia miyamotoi TaxID=47466 RepID=A0A481YLS2_9SPIR|nr:DUF226 domain-containing protein [Borrelia miyamotoi]ATQ19060.1 DUF226 domain-containing protein [Borrelia miyamotoi]ATQ20243.1 DUF226 domain-containing protein [Borrelia miyamotoi]QBK63911.1 DUF226 domain-containing protein [Borrelia miyamotoi]QBL99350.1 DUF226 domain-containing protein [Borrelia miyamotoi]WAZ72701.1 DUF226 domain-containing protein [Borrelia miyamotoi]